jgi:hypothetical protein
MSEFPELRAALVAAAERRRQLAGSGGARMPASSRRSWWPVQLRALALAVVTLLGIAAVALAAAGVFSPGRPVAPVSVPKPRTFNGAAILSTIRVPAVRAGDPAGGPEWGLRLLDTTRGEVCIAPGRVQDGIIGVLGRDRAFADDGRLHPFEADYIDPLGCAVPDARGHAFLNIGQTGLPASALSPGIAAPAGGCRVDNPPPANRRLLCSSMDLRDVYYGLLGPDAVSVTYRASSGDLATERTAGPDGAYLIVLPYARGHLQGNATIGTGLSGGPILSVRYRDGHTCATAHDHTCGPVGYRTPRGTHVTAAQVRAPVSAYVVAARSYCSPPHSSTVVPCSTRVPAGFSRIGGAPFVLIDISFTARVPVANSNSRYQMDLSYAGSHGCTIGGLGGPTNADIHAGQRVHMQDFHPLSCPGPVHGVVRYVQGSALGTVGLPGSPVATSVVVGRFVVNPTASRPASR